MLNDVPSLKDILNNRTDGASTLYKAALSLIIHNSYYHTQSHLRSMLRKLRVSFPEMAVFVYLEQEMRGLPSAGIGAKAMELRDRAGREIGDIGALVDRIWKTPKRLILFSRSSVVDRIARERTHKISGVIVSEAAPQKEGLLVANDMMRLGLKVTVITDAALPGLVTRGDIVLLGADCVTETYFVNKTGSYPLLLAARVAGARSIIVHESFKQVRSRDFAFVSRNHPADEILPKAPKGISVYNPYFESVPLSLVDCVVSSDGILRPEK